jgi:hypothetical protein
LALRLTIFFGYSFLIIKNDYLLTAFRPLSILSPFTFSVRLRSGKDPPILYRKKKNHYISISNFHKGIYLRMQMTCN